MPRWWSPRARARSLSRRYGRRHRRPTAWLRTPSTRTIPARPSAWRCWSGLDWASLCQCSHEDTSDLSYVRSIQPPDAKVCDPWSTAGMRKPGIEVVVHAAVLGLYWVAMNTAVGAPPSHAMGLATHADLHPRLDLRASVNGVA